VENICHVLRGINALALLYFAKMGAACTQVRRLWIWIGISCMQTNTLWLQSSYVTFLVLVSTTLGPKKFMCFHLSVAIWRKIRMGEPLF